MEDCNIISNENYIYLKLSSAFVHVALSGINRNIIMMSAIKKPILSSLFAVKSKNAYLIKIESWPHFGLQETDANIIKGLGKLIYLKSKKKGRL